MLIKRGKKAQISLEFLMTYGWVIFLVIGVIAAFSFFGVIYPESFVSERCFLSPPLFCEDSAFSLSTGDVIFRIRNSLNEGVNIQEISLSENLGCWTLLLSSPSQKDLRFIESGSSKDFVIDCDITGNQPVNGEIVIKYAEEGTPEGLVKISTGSIIGRV